MTLVRLIHDSGSCSKEAKELPTSHKARHIACEESRHVSNFRRLTAVDLYAKAEFTEKLAGVCNMLPCCSCVKDEPALVRQCA